MAKPGKKQKRAELPKGRTDKQITVETVIVEKP
jgi:hypothetical protein